MWVCVSVCTTSSSARLMKNSCTLFQNWDPDGGSQIERGLGSVSWPSWVCGCGVVEWVFTTPLDLHSSVLWGLLSYESYTFLVLLTFGSPLTDTVWNLWISFFSLLKLEIVFISLPIFHYESAMVFPVLLTWINYYITTATATTTITTSIFKLNLF